MAQSDEMISAAPQYQKLGDSDRDCAKAYRKFARQKPSAQQVEEITNATMKGWVLGDNRFARKIEKLSGRRATQLPKGRPKGS
jgi:putative transposase